MSSAKWRQRGRQALANGALDEALKAYRKAHKRDPRAEEPLAALCHLHYLRGDSEQALSHARVLYTHGYAPRAKRHAGLILIEQGQLEEALACLLAAQPLQLSDSRLVPHLNSTAMQLADWTTARQCQQYLSACYRRGDFRRPAENPWRSLGWCGRDDWNRQLSADYWARRHRVKGTPPLATSSACRIDRPLRVGYLSGDWRQHPNLMLSIGVFEQHDPSAIEPTIYCYSREDGSELRDRLRRAVPRLVSLAGLSDQEAARRIHADGIDVLVDRKGLTKGSRSGILAYRPAPLQVNWLGYAGSIASGVHDYILADPYVIPRGAEAGFDEAVCRLPDVYMSTDNRRRIAAPPSSRAEQGLPEHAVVFCCFNQPYKLEPVRWKTFMAILRDVPGSVLWLLDTGAAVRARLQIYARHLGVEPERLIFAERCANADHLARIDLADLSLDTRIYTGHTTTVDALWAGVPVLATVGTHFASRVSESLLRAMALPDLVMSDEAAFHRHAVALAITPGALEQLKDRVRENRGSAPLFDTVRFTRHLEYAYRAMVQRAAAGKPPETFDVPRTTL
ncbi:hypothetical protein KZO25_03395 [Halomonas sp. ANAO-440]|uniref:O-linked N-acetylglucosamine transferase, SPINDLY family protein n=1 Tax=Halomonas sp. ANAO-440 TaxID=2861360 RepID=UPI001CAA6431|nr:hypothetical protein [Halomonas sp. ANAO-440]MBZ0329355.1 hypothetical protein [Halomonas sp. ANAO-440]